MGEPSNKAIGEDLNYPVIALIGFLFVLLTVTSIFFLQGMYYQTTRQEMERKVVRLPNAKLRAHRIAQEEKLNGYAWVDREKKTVSIPIDRAMDLILHDGLRKISGGPHFVTTRAETAPANAPSPRTDAGQTGGESGRPSTAVDSTASGGQIESDSAHH